jgi:hypothetical protein
LKPGGDSVLAIPDGWVIDDIVVGRLGRQLARVDAAVPGVVAPVAPLPPGSSYQVCAERALLTPEACLDPSPDDAPRGAVLLRPGVPFEVRADAVAVPHRGLLVDHGAVVHDPWAPGGPPEPASPLGRPPFPWRPVTLFLGTTPDPLLADWVRQMVNGLLRMKDVEARMAVPSPTRGLHLARPCTPEAATVAALAPDVVVALDEGAIDAAASWLNGDRSAVVVELTPGTEPVPEVVSWRIGEARGRLRARVSRGVDAEGLATLVRRLCAGPQPLPPRRRKRGPVRPKRPQPSSPAVGALDPSTRLVGLVGAPADGARFGGFADHIAAYGGRLAIHTVDGRIPPVAEEADILLVRSLASSDLMRGLVAARARAGRLTVVDLASTDVVTPATHRVELRPEAADLARSASALTTTSPRLAALLRTRGIRAHVLPTLITRSRAAALTRRRSRRPAGPSHIIGWHAGTRHPDGDTHRAAVLDTLRTLLAARPDLTIEVVGDVPEAAAPLRGDGVTVSPGTPTLESVSGWRLQLWTTSSIDAELTGDVGPVVDAQYLGVPTLVAADNVAVHEGLVARGLAVDGPDQWRSAVTALVDDEGAWSMRSAQAARLAEALYGPGSSLATLNRLLGWLRFEGAA